MNYYLSSYKLGNETEHLKQMAPKGKIGYIPNALDFTGADPERRKKHIEADAESLRALGLEVEIIDLKEYFHEENILQDKLKELGAVFVSGGNVFVLRQAMKLSGLDNILKDFSESDAEFLYAGYSAAGCVLAPSLKAYEIVDPIDMPYPEITSIIWDGLGLVDFAFTPHWDSDHPESADIGKVIDYCISHNIPYRTVRDGEVIII